MHSGENLGSGAENAGEGARRINRERGAKVEQAAREARRRELLEQRRQIDARLAELKAEREELLRKIAEREQRKNGGARPTGVVSSAATSGEVAPAVPTAEEIEREASENVERATLEAEEREAVESAEVAESIPVVEEASVVEEAPVAEVPVAESGARDRMVFEMDDAEPVVIDFRKAAESRRRVADEAEVEPEAVSDGGEAAGVVGEKPSEAEVRAAKEKAKKNRKFKKFVTSAVLVAMAGLIGVGGVISNWLHRNKDTVPQQPSIRYEETMQTPAPEPIDLALDYEDTQDVVAEEVDEQEAANPYAGELENGTSYDYSHYADREHKEAYNAYDYDQSGAYEDREATEQGIMEVAGRSPEALASYAYSLFTEQEKQELGIAGMSATEIDDYMSNNENGGAMQTRLMERMREVLGSEDTAFVYYHENGTEKTYYDYFVDTDGDGVMTPDEVHLGYDTRTRHNAPQVDIYRTYTDEQGVVHQDVKMLDLNMPCGYQPNFEVPPEGVPYVPANPDPEPEPEPTPTPEPEPEPTPTPEPEPEPTPTPEPEPEPTPTPEPEPEPTPTPEPEPEPTPTPEPEPEPTPTPEPEPEPTPTPEPEPEPTPTPQPKNEEAERENAGPDVTPLELNEDVTPATDLEEDQENFEAIQRQQEEDARAAEEAERVAAEQAERERQAAEEAERRRQEEEAARQAELDRMAEEERVAREAAEAEAQRQADEAAARAAEQAAAEQAVAAEAERAVAAEQAAREQAQAEANAAAAEVAQQVTAEQEARRQAQEEAGVENPTGQPTAAERADMFANGDF